MYFRVKTYYLDEMHNKVINNFKIVLTLLKNQFNKTLTLITRSVKRKGIKRWISQM